MKHIHSSVHTFTSLADAGFTAMEYSRLKFGSDSCARKFGFSLAEDFFAKHADTLLASNCVVIPSPYNFVRNAATVMTGHFVNRLNELLVNANGEHVEYDVIKRRVSYINDYGFLSHAKRKSLIAKDSFYLNRDFYQGKTLIFVDDVKITGAHEDRLIEVLAENGIKNDAFFLYFAEYHGNNPKIEAELNFAAVSCLADYEDIADQENHHIIVRPIKYLLGYKDSEELKQFLMIQSRVKQETIYYAALAEGYYKVPAYQKNFSLLCNLLKVTPQT